MDALRMVYKTTLCQQFTLLRSAGIISALSIGTTVELRYDADFNFHRGLSGLACCSGFGSEGWSGTFLPYW